MDRWSRCSQLVLEIALGKIEVIMLLTVFDRHWKIFQMAVFLLLLCLLGRDGIAVESLIFKGGRVLTWL